MVLKCHMCVCCHFIFQFMQICYLMFNIDCCFVFMQICYGLCWFLIYAELLFSVYADFLFNVRWCDMEDVWVWDLRPWELPDKVGDAFCCLFLKPTGKYFVKCVYVCVCVSVFACACAWECVCVCMHMWTYNQAQGPVYFLRPSPFTVVTYEHCCYYSLK